MESLQGQSCGHDTAGAHASATEAPHPRHCQSSSNARCAPEMVPHPPLPFTACIAHLACPACSEPSMPGAPAHSHGPGAERRRGGVLLQHQDRPRQGLALVLNHKLGARVPLILVGGRRGRVAPHHVLLAGLPLPCRAPWGGGGGCEGGWARGRLGDGWGGGEALPTASLGKRAPLRQQAQQAHVARAKHEAWSAN